jgi:S1-C subfamily serine protease
MKRKNQVLIWAVLALLLMSGASTLFAQDAPPTPGFLGVAFVANADGQAVITIVEEGSPAAEAGLMVDDVIMTINGEAVVAGDLPVVIRSYTAGDAITVTVMRGEETIEAEVTLAAIEPIANSFRAQMGGVGAWLGVQVEKTEAGIVILEVIPDSPAEGVGLLVDDVIVTVNDEDITEIGSLQRIIRSFSPGDGIVLGIEREGASQDIEITLGEMPLLPDNMRVFPGRNVLRFLQDELAWEVGELEEGSPLAEAGLQEGDRIVGIDGEDFEADAPMSFFRNLTPDGAITLSVERGDETLEIEIPSMAVIELFVGAMPNLPGDLGQRDNQNVPGRGDQVPVPGQQRNRVWLGVRYLMIDDEIAAARNLPVTDGVLLIEVEAFSPAEVAGLQAGDIVTAINDELIDFENPVEMRFNAYTPGETVTLAVVRGEESLSIEVTLESPPRSG